MWLQSLQVIQNHIVELNLNKYIRIFQFDDWNRRSQVQVKETSFSIEKNLWL